VLTVQIAGPEQIGLIEVPEPSPAPGDVLVKIERLSICGSDMRYYRSPDVSDYPFPPGYPFHECAGTVADGGGTTFRAGDRVVVLTPDRRGGAEFLACPPERLVPVPDEGDLSLWVLAQPIGTVLYPCASLEAVGRTVVVFGQGPLGLAFTQILGGMRPLELIAVDLHDYRLDHARALGASVGVNPARDDIREIVSARTEGNGADIVVDTTGRAEVINTALDLVRLRGTVSCFGQPVREPIDFNYKTFSKKEIRLLPTITHSRPDPTEGVALAVELIGRGRLDVSWMVTHRFPLAEVAKAFEIYANQADGCLKVVVEV
jgi:L-iditol 2-dehydrogenase